MSSAKQEHIDYFESIITSDKILLCCKEIYPNKWAIWCQNIDLPLPVGSKRIKLLVPKKSVIQDKKQQTNL